MTTSGRLINYQLRPAKNVERKMLRDLFYRLTSFDKLKNYQYIGFGSHYFSDFILFHKSLHINKMISIEKDSSSKDKYIFNQPFKCVDVKFGESNDILPTLNYEFPSILWLDYDKRFNPPMMNDIDTFSQNCSSGSILLISFNSQPHRLENLQSEFETNEDTGLFERKIKSETTERYFPASFREQGIRKWSNYSNLIREAISARIIDTLLGRNISDQKINFKQICFFNYKDGVEMTTVGFIFYTEQELHKYDACNFSDLDFFSETAEPYLIEIPNLTMKEIKILMQNMPNVDTRTLPKGVFTSKDIEIFQKIYKYFPTYMDVEYS